MDSVAIFSAFFCLKHSTCAPSEQAKKVRYANLFIFATLLECNFATFEIRIYTKSTTTRTQNFTLGYTSLFDKLKLFSLGGT